MSTLFYDLSTGMESISDLLGSTGNLSTTNPLKESFEALSRGDSSGFSSGDSITLSKEEFKTMLSYYELGQEELEFMISEEKRVKVKLSRADRKKAKKLLKETMKSEKSFSAVLITLAEQAEKAKSEGDNPEESQENLAMENVLLYYIIGFAVGGGLGIFFAYLLLCHKVDKFDQEFLEEERDKAWSSARQYSNSDQRKVRRLAKRMKRWGDFIDKRIKKRQFGIPGGPGKAEDELDKTMDQISGGDE